MKVVDIKRGRTQLEALLDKFRKTLQFEDFLAAVEYCLEKNIDDTAILEEEWETQQQSVLFDNGMECLSKLLAKIKIGYDLIISNKPEMDSEQSEKISQSFRELFQTHAEEETQRKQISDKYSWFYPSFIINDSLQSVYPEELDPGQIIAKYLKQLFPDNVEKLVPNFTNYTKVQKIYSIKFESPLHSLIITISQAAIYQIYSDNETLKLIVFGECREILDPENNEQRKFPSETIVIKLIIFSMLAMPAELFYSWYDAMISRLFCDDTPDESKINFLMAALTTFSFGKHNLPLAANNINDDSSDFYYDLDFWRYVAAEKYLSYGDMFWLLYINLEEADNKSDDSRAVVSKLIQSFTKLRRKYFTGMFPANWGNCSQCAGEIVGFIGHENSDFLVMLTEANYDTILCLFPGHVKPYQQRCDDLDKAQKYYLTLFDKALEEGLPEFAVSLLSIYIFLRAISEQCHFGNLPDLMPAIDRAIALPGSKTLKHTLAFVVDSVDTYLSDDPIAACSAAYFRPYIPKQADLHVIEGAGKSAFRLESSESDVKTFLENELGRDRWHSLSENSRSCLVSAELQWRNNASVFGFAIKDWSDLITTYCKAIEGELVARLDDFFNCGEYEAYLSAKGLKRPAKATAGWLLKELKSYDAMPPSLQELLSNSRIRLAGNNDLINRLYDIVQNYRNISAHHDAVPMKRFAEFKEKMFQSGLLHKFIDAFA